MKARDLREMTEEEVLNQHDNMIDELVNLRIKLQLKQIDNPLRVRELRREIARVKTVLKEKQEGSKPGQQPGKA